MPLEISEELKLVTSKFSPYGHRVEITLIEKSLPYEKEDVNLADKPEWFKKNAPLGQAPLLHSDNNILFDSTAICEYLEDAFPKHPLHVENTVNKSQHRAWMVYSDVILNAIFGVMFAKDSAQFKIKKADLITKLDQLETHLDNNDQLNPYFGGEIFTLADVFFLATLKPLTYIDNKFTLEILKNHKHIQTYITHLMSRTSLKKVMPANYEELFISFLKKKNSHLLTLSFSL